MYNNRLIPCLLLMDQGLVKTKRFNSPRYVGDPINAVRIFNDKEVDELIFLDINATKEKRGPRFDFIAKIAEQCFMPLCYGGGVSTLEDMRELFRIGIEKVAVNHCLYHHPELVKEAVKIYGGQSIVGSIDIKKNFWGKYTVRVLGGKQDTKTAPVEYAKRIEALGVGEIFLNSIDRDGMMDGYDIELVRMVSESVQVPVIACGGAGKQEDLQMVIEEGRASAAAAGSYFVFYGNNKAVLINYPDSESIKKMWSH